MGGWKLETGKRRPPRRGAWIEIVFVNIENRYCISRPPRRGAWIEILYAFIISDIYMSPPAQGGVD